MTKLFDSVHTSSSAHDSWLARAEISTFSTDPRSSDLYLKKKNKNNQSVVLKIGYKKRNFKNPMTPR